MKWACDWTITKKREKSLGVHGSSVLTVNASSLCPKEKIPLAFSASSGGKPASIISNKMNGQLHETSINWRSLATCLGISDHRRPKKSSRVTSNLTFGGSGSNTLFGLTLTGLFLKRQCKVTPVIPSWTGWSVGFTSLLWTDLRIFMSTVSTRPGIVSPNASMVVVSTCTSFMALKNRHIHAMLPSVQHWLLGRK